MNKLWLQIGGLALVFTVLYFTVRSLPLPQCELAHYGDSINEAGEIDYCGTEETFFFDLDRLSYPVRATLKPLDPPTRGVESHFTVSLKTLSGRMVTPADVIVSHTQAIHLLVVDPSLKDYQHLHPQPTGAPGEWQFSFTPNKSGTYRFYFDFVTLHGAKRTLIAETIEVPGDAEPFDLNIPRQTVTTSDGYAFDLILPEGEFDAEGTHTLTLVGKATDAASSDLQLEKVMGAFAHVVAFDPTRTGFAHLHPTTPIIPGQKNHAPEVAFAFNPRAPGNYRLWAQIKVAGEERFLPFDVLVVSSR